MNGRRMGDRPGRTRFATVVALSGFTVGAIATAAATFFGAGSCGPRELYPPFDAGPDCLAFVGGMALRTGIATGLATVVIVLVAAGLFRTAERIEDDRRTAARERYANEDPADGDPAS